MIIEKLKNNYWLLIWGIFLTYLILQHDLIWMHIDDYGYASLNYAVSVNTIGNNYTVLDIFRYLYEHYMQWGGRIFFYGIAIFIYHFGGLEGIRVFQCIIIFLMFFLVFWISTRKSNKTDKTILSIIVCLLYGVFQIEVANCGLYWFSASSGYVWPILFVFCASYYLYRLIEIRDFTLYKWLICSILWLIASFSQEQIAVASIVICFMLCIYGIIRRSGCIALYLLPSVSTVLGAGIMLLAPGNFGRLNETSNMGFFEQIEKNVPFLLGYICGHSTRIFLITVFVCFAFVTRGLLRFENRKYVRLFLRSIFVLQMIVLSIMLVATEFFATSDTIIRMALTMLIGLGVLLMGYYLIIIEEIWAFCCFAGAIMCYAAMAVVPAIPIRIYIPFVLLMLPAITVIFNKDIRSIYSYILLTPLSVLLLFNMIDIYEGYKLNNPIQESNWQALSTYNGVEDIKLKKMYDDLYTAPLSYMEGYEWSDYLICKYFDIPEQTSLVWE